MKLKLEMKFTHKPDEIELTPEKTALIIIDMQNDVCCKGGMVDHTFAAAGMDLSRMRAPIEPIRRVAAAARKKGIKVIHIYTALRPDLSDAPKVLQEVHLRTHTPIGAKIGPPGEKNIGSLIRGTWNTEFIDELKPQPGDIAVEKKTYGGFQDTDLELILRNLEVDTLIFTGLATHMCLESTLREAFMRGFRVFLIKDCTATINDELQRNTERIVEFWFGYVTTSDKFIESLTAP